VQILGAGVQAENRGAGTHHDRGDQADHQNGQAVNLRRVVQQPPGCGQDHGCGDCQ
jgi:hypothetical protein